MLAKTLRADVITNLDVLYKEHLKKIPLKKLVIGSAIERMVTLLNDYGVGDLGYFESVRKASIVFERLCKAHLPTEPKAISLASTIKSLLAELEELLSEKTSPANRIDKPVKISKSNSLKGILKNLSKEQWDEYTLLFKADLDNFDSNCRKFCEKHNLNYQEFYDGLSGRGYSSTEKAKKSKPPKPKPPKERRTKDLSPKEWAEYVRIFKDDLDQEDPTMKEFCKKNNLHYNSFNVQLQRRGFTVGEIRRERRKRFKEAIEAAQRRLKEEQEAIQRRVREEQEAETRRLREEEEAAQKKLQEEQEAEARRLKEEQKMQREGFDARNSTTTQGAGVLLALITTLTTHGPLPKGFIEELKALLKKWFFES